MNTLSIVTKNLKNFISKNTVVFFIMFISLILSTVTILYVVVKLDSLSFGLSAGDLSLNQIDLVNEESQLAVDDISDRFQSYQDSDSSVICFTGNISSENGYISSFVTNEKKLLGEYSENNKPLEGRFFTDEEIEKGDNVIITVGIGKDLNEIELRDEKIEIVGKFVRNGLTNAYIPAQTLINNHFIPDNYTITYDHDLSVKEIKQMKVHLEELFPEFKVMSQMDDYLGNGAFVLKFENICLILMAVVALISCAYLYSYIIQMRIKEIYIFKICGSSAGRLIKIFICELFVLLSAQLIVTLAIFNFVLMKVLSTYDVAFVYGFSWIHVLISFAIIVALSLIIFLPILLYYCKKMQFKLSKGRKDRKNDTKICQ